MEQNDNGIPGGDSEPGVGPDLAGSPSTGAANTLGAGGNDDLDPDPVDDADPETNGAG